MKKIHLEIKANLRISVWDKLFGEGLIMFQEQLLSATQTMKMLNVSRSHFYINVINDSDFKAIVKPVSLVANGVKQYRETDIVSFISKKQNAIEIIN